MVVVAGAAVGRHALLKGRATMRLFAAARTGLARRQRAGQRMGKIGTHVMAAGASALVRPSSAVARRAMSASASGGDEAQSIRSKIDDLNAAHDVVIYAKSYCPYCKEAKRMFEGLDQAYFALELDEIDEGPAVQQELAGMTGITTVPHVFVRGSFFGTCDGTRAAIANGELAKRLAQ